ncbi:MAG TPA: hypothetical protein VK589_24315 [Chryseolinea sp.]|nr:hypothetical protein [Chryseolinea sp.]
MKPKMMSKQSMDYLFDHILDGFKTSHEGIINLQRQQIVSDDEINDLVKKNSERLIERIREFRMHEKLFGIFFACLFTYLQVDGEDLEMRRSSRSRTRRRSETENIITL